MERQDLLTMAETCGLVGVSKQTLLNYRKSETLNFPKPVLMGRGRKYFVKEEVQDWLNQNVNNANKRGEY